MKIRYQADNDLNRAIVEAIWRLEPRIDFRSAQAAKLDGVPDDIMCWRVRQRNNASWFPMT